MEISNDILIGSILALTIKQEAENKMIKLPLVDESSIDIRVKVLHDGVKYTVIGEIGQLLNYPEVEVMFNDIFEEYDIPNLNLIKYNVYNEYKSLVVLEYIENNSEVEY